MLRISTHQQAKLSHISLERFIDATGRQLEQHFPRLYGLRGPDKTREWIRHGIEQAKAYDILEARDLRRFIVLLYARGIGFEQQEAHSWIRDILYDDTRSGRWKMDQIQDGLLADGSEH